MTKIELLNKKLFRGQMKETKKDKWKFTFLKLFISRMQ